MSKKHTIGLVREQFEAEGYILLSDVYVNANDLLEYICPKGDIGVIKWTAWQQGHRCAKCAGVKKLTIKFIRKEFEKEGYTLLSKKYTGCAQKLEYMCPKGHCWGITWNDWRDGCRCSECGGTKKLTIAFIREQFEKEGYVLLSKKYVNSKAVLEYICPNNHNRTITWDGWQHGGRCQTCWFEKNSGSGNYNYNPNLTEEDRQNRRLIPEYTEWAHVVKKRDNFTCQVCGNNKGGNLVSHHLDSYNSNPNLRTALSNGVCLCKNCHKNFHHLFGYGNNTRKQFEEFMKMGV